MNLFLKYGPPHPVKDTLENQVETSDIPPPKVRHQLWKYLICNNHQYVCPWGTTTNGTDRDAKKALLWHLQRSRMPQIFRTGSPYGRAHYHRRPATTTTNDNNLSPIAGKTEYQAVIVTIENCADSRQPQIATVRWLTWKGVD